MVTFDECRAMKLRQGKRLLARNTYLREAEDGYQIWLHETAVVTVRADGTCLLDSGGWLTVTTKDRINRFSPARVWSVKGRWVIGGTGDNPVRFADRIIVDAAGLPVGDWPRLRDETPEDTANKVMSRAITAYVAGYTGGKVRELREAAEARGTGGDCWFCALVTKDGQPMGDGDTAHLKSHVSERHYMASLILNALTAKGYRSPGTVMAIDRDGSLTRRAMSTYLRKRLLTGVAVR